MVKKIIFFQIIALLLVAIGTRFFKTVRHLTFPEMREKVIESRI